MLLIALGVVLLALPLGAKHWEQSRENPSGQTTPRTPESPPYLRTWRIRENLRKRREERLRKDVQDELVAIIDQGDALRGDAFSEVPYGPTRFWTEKTQGFIEAVFGPAERQRLQEAVSLDERLRHLGRLRDGQEDWHVLVDTEALQRACEVRRHVPASDRIILAGSPAGDAQTPKRLDRVELAIDLRAMADSLDRALTARRPQEEEEAASMVERGRELELQDSSLIKKIAIERAADPTVAMYQENFKGKVERLFDEAWELGVVMRSARRCLEKPKGSTLSTVPDRLRRIADRLEQFEAPS